MTVRRVQCKSPELIPEPAWIKSSYSTQNNGNCVEVALLSDGVGIRDSKITEGPGLHVGVVSWSAFVDFISR
ncbi:DUF397 domain-containing protein [Streptomyces sp. NPDC003077]|uniref:DUF397 domain-containing protein n=1 Tax=Streptomyces sp. NPDC003077 TaxID=3154443 RepID=UPI0033B36EF2